MRKSTLSRRALVGGGLGLAAASLTTPVASQQSSPGAANPRGIDVRSSNGVGTAMTKAFWVVTGDVSDPEGYKAYVAENANAFRKYQARFIVRGGKSETAEGRPRSRAVVIEFPSFEAAVECYRSPEYKKAKALREGKADLDINIVEGYDGPQPT